MLHKISGNKSKTFLNKYLKYKKGKLSVNCQNGKYQTEEFT